MLLSPPPKMQFLGDDGLPLSGGLVYTYAMGTTTPQITYTDSGGISANTNPIVLDLNGRCDLWFQQLSYTLLVYSSIGILQGCSGNILFPEATAGGGSVEVYADDVPYSFPDQVVGTDGYTYRCVGVDILDDDPVGSVTGNWVNLSPSNFVSPAFTGTPTAPTATALTTLTQIATLGFVVGTKPAISTNVPLKGDIRGGWITVSGNVLTFLPCSCINSTGLVQLVTDANKTLTIPSTVSQDFYIFIVRKVSDSSIEFRAYTTLAGAASDTEINAYRWVSYAKNNSSGVTMPFIQVGDRIDWTTSSKPVLTATTTVGYTSYNPQTVIHATFKTFIPWDTTGRLFFSYDGVTALTVDSIYCQMSLLPTSTIYIKYQNISSIVYITSVTLDR